MGMGPWAMGMGTGMGMGRYGYGYSGQRTGQRSWASSRRVWEVEGVEYENGGAMGMGMGMDTDKKRGTTGRMEREREIWGQGESAQWNRVKRWM